MGLSTCDRCGEPLSRPVLPGYPCRQSHPDPSQAEFAALRVAASLGDHLDAELRWSLFDRWVGIVEVAILSSPGRRRDANMRRGSH